MKARIGIASEELVRKYILDVAAGKLNHVEDMPQFWFASLTELSQVLTNDNIKLLNMMAYERPNSVGVETVMGGDGRVYVLFCRSRVS